MQQRKLDKVTIIRDPSNQMLDYKLLLTTAEQLHNEGKLFWNTELRKYQHNTLDEPVFYDPHKTKS